MKKRRITGGASGQRNAIDSKTDKTARNAMKIRTLRYHRGDQTDFHELSVVQIRLSLRAAYEAGRNSKK